MTLHRDFGVRQATAWFMLHRIRLAFSGVKMIFEGPVEGDGKYTGGLEKSKHEKKKLNAGRDPVGKTAVVGMKDRRRSESVRIDRLLYRDLVANECEYPSRPSTNRR